MTISVNIKIEKTEKDQAQQVAKELGMTLSGLVKVLLRDVVRHKRLNLVLEEELSDWAIKELEESATAAKKGYISPPFADAEAGIAWLNDPNATYANGRPVRE